MTFIQQWISHPQALWVRKALFQIHLWTGLGIGLYMLMISLTGSVLVYRNELFTLTRPAAIIATGSGPRLTDDELKAAALQAYPGYKVARINRARNPDQAVDVWLRRGGKVEKRLFDPYTGSDRGESVPFGTWLVSEL